MDSSANHLLYILTDSNLPTGGFIASSGLESYVTHGLLRPATYTAAKPNETPPPRKEAIGRWITQFGAAEIDNFASTSIPYINDAWAVCSSNLNGQPTTDGSPEETLNSLERLDEHHEAALLSHVARRASKAQGVALLTLYVKSFACSGGGDEGRRRGADELVKSYKTRVRGGRAPGHLAICWGILCAALGLDQVLEQCAHLHLYLHARSLLSAAVRLNQIGPYESTALLATRFKDLIESAVQQYQRVRTGLLDRISPRESIDVDPWAWADDAEIHGPATTWPLGEILVGRHDLQHTRLFNS